MKDKFIIKKWRDNLYFRLPGIILCFGLLQLFYINISLWSIFSWFSYLFIFVLLVNFILKDFINIKKQTISIFNLLRMRYDEELLLDLITITQERKKNKGLDFVNQLTLNFKDKSVYRISLTFMLKREKEELFSILEKYVKIENGQMDW